VTARPWPTPLRTSSLARARVFPFERSEQTFQHSAAFVIPVLPVTALGAMAGRDIQTSFVTVSPGQRDE
jgi:hypothetical protein